MCVASYRPERDALVLLQLRVDGQIQVRVRVSRLGLGLGFGLAANPNPSPNQALSNSSEDAWGLVRATFFGHAPNFHGRLGLGLGLG